VIGGAARDLLIAATRVHNSGRFGIVFVDSGFIDPFPLPNRRVAVTENEVTGSANSGIYTRPGTLADSLIADNTSSGAPTQHRPRQPRR
jgi:hypothetical protein